MKRDRPNYGIIRQEYVEGYDLDGRIFMPSLDELADRHNVNRTNLGKRAGKQGWRAERLAFATKVRLERQKARGAELGKEGAAFDRRMLRFAVGFMKQIERAQRHVRSSKVAPDHLELSRLGQAARHAQSIVRVALGEENPDDTPVPLPVPGQTTTTIRVVYERQPLPKIDG